MVKLIFVADKIRDAANIRCLLDMRCRTGTVKTQRELFAGCQPHLSHLSEVLLVLYYDIFVAVPIDWQCKFDQIMTTSIVLAGIVHSESFRHVDGIQPIHYLCPSLSTLNTLSHQQHFCNHNVNVGSSIESKSQRRGLQRDTTL